MFDFEEANLKGCMEAEYQSDKTVPSVSLILWALTSIDIMWRPHYFCFFWSVLVHSLKYITLASPSSNHFPSLILPTTVLNATQAFLTTMWERVWAKSGCEFFWNIEWSGS